MIDKPVKTQHKIFENEVLPSLFHDTPEQFIRLLQREGTRFLQFYWAEAGKKIPPGEHTTSYGLKFSIEQPTRHMTVVLVTLPEPQVEGEAYYVALIYRPLRVSPFGFLTDTTKVITMRRVTSTEGKPGTLLVEVDRRLRRESLGPGPEVNLDVFYTRVLTIIEG